jgi:hypothetical protein
MNVPKEVKRSVRGTGGSDPERSPHADAATCRNVSRHLRIY